MPGSCVSVFHFYDFQVRIEMRFLLHYLCYNSILKIYIELTKFLQKRYWHFSQILLCKNIQSMIFIYDIFLQ